MKKLILVTGARGQLGACIKDISSQYGDSKFIFTDIDELDVTDSQIVSSFFKKCQPDWVVNCAGYTSVDKAEIEPEKARLLNVEAVGLLVEECKKINAGFIHISTDYVYDGSLSEPLCEDANVNPLSVYGKTKLEGEKIALSYSNSVILRTGAIFSEYGNNLLTKVIKSGKENKEINLPGDLWETPTSAHDLSKAIMTIITKPSYGLFHFSNEGLASLALFAEEIFNQANIECAVKYVSYEQCNYIASRPVYSLLSKKKFSKTFKVDIPEWEVALEHVLRKF